MILLFFFTFFLIILGIFFIFKNQIIHYLIEYIYYLLHEYFKSRRPKRIILVRNGRNESSGNYDILETVPDNKIHLIDKGIEDAKKAGKKIKEIIKNESIRFYVSPYARTKETFEYILSELKDNKYTLQYHPSLRGQEHGNFQSDMKEQFEKQKKVGVLYYRFRDGQSGNDVATETSIFLANLFREYSSFDYEQCDNAILVTHSLTIQFFILNFFKLPIEEYDKFRLPDFGEVFVLEKNERGRYKLLTDIYLPPYLNQYRKLSLDE